MIANDGNLEHFAGLARAAQASGVNTIDVKIEAQRGFSKYVHLWENIVGQVIGREFETPTEPATPEIARPRVVSHFVVRVGVADVLGAYRRRAEREARQFGDVSV